jgi:hypothetical protein
MACLLISDDDDTLMTIPNNRDDSTVTGNSIRIMHLNQPAQSQHKHQYRWYTIGQLPRVCYAIGSTVL